MDLQPIRLSTRDLPGEGRDELVREFYGKIAQRIEIELADDDPYEIEVKAMLLPGATVGGGVVSRMAGTRTAAMRADGGSDVVLTFSRQGLLVAEADGGETAVAPGDVLLTSLDRPTRMFMPCEQNAFLTLQLSRSALQPLVPDLDDKLTQALSFERPAMRLLHSYVATLADEAPRDWDLRAVAARHLAELAALAVGPAVGGRELARGGGVRAARLAAAKAEVVRHLRSPELSAAFVARRVGISPRYLHMLFEAEPESFADYVTGRRLDLAAKQLADESGRVLDIALALGFGDVTTFNRAFRRRFGLTPSEARRAWSASGPPSPQNPS